MTVWEMLKYLSSGVGITFRLVPLCILLAIPGFVGWIVPWFLYRAMVRRRTKVVDGLMERKYDEIDEICQKGHQLLV